MIRPLLLLLLLLVLQLQLQFLLQGRSRRRWKSFVEVDLGDVAYAGNATDDAIPTMLRMVLQMVLLAGVNL